MAEHVNADAVRPGRLGNADLDLGTDPRSDPRMVAELAKYGLSTIAPAPTLTVDSELEEKRAFIEEAEVGFEGLYAALFDGLPPVEGVDRYTVTITGHDDNLVTLYIHRPTATGGALPALLHIHGGGMVMLEAAGACYARWRDELAAAGMVVVGVEFRNAAGTQGPHPFPAGLNDCEATLRWMVASREALGISKIVVSGESGGGNLTLALALRAARDGWISDIDGVYALSPCISNGYATQPPEFPSLRENDGYVSRCDVMAVLVSVYDPGEKNASDPTCWPINATTEDLAGMPPHMISVNELDPFRDEGLSYFRKLLAAGVDAGSRTVNGTCHTGDSMLRAALPDIFAATVSDIRRFAYRV
jgi:acetyl esterase/lipase